RRPLTSTLRWPSRSPMSASVSTKGVTTVIAMSDEGSSDLHRGELRGRAAGAFVVLDHHGVRAGRQRYVDGVGRGSVVAPAVDDHGSVELHPDAVVTGGGEAVGPGGVVGDPGPAGGEEVVRYRRVRRAAEAPVEVHRLVVAGDHRGPGQVGVGEVLGRERRICRWWWGVTRCERELRHRTATVL